VFGLNRFFGVRAPYEQVASDSGGGVGSTSDNPGPDPAGGAGSTPSGDPAGGTPAGAGQTPPPTALSDDDRRAIAEYNRLRQEFGGELPKKADIDRLRQTLATATGIAPGEPAEDPRAARIREGIIKSVPGLDKLLALADRVDDIAGLLDRAPAYDASADAHWRNVATVVKTDLHNAFASATLGAGKSAADLSDEQRKEISVDFGMWLKADRARVERYESGDGKALVGEFLNRSRSLWGSAQRETVAGHVARLPNAPAEGSFGSAPAGNRGPAAPAAGQTQDERLDAAIDRAAQFVNAGGQ
jgi:hypothetical protein